MTARYVCGEELIIVAMGPGHIDLIDKSTTNVDLKSLLEFEIHARDIFRERGRIQDATDMEASIENVRHSLLTLGIS